MIAKYFHSRWKVILLYFFIILTYLCISFLYPYDNDPILYASQILGGIGIVIFFLDYYSFQKKYKHLKITDKMKETKIIAKAENFTATDFGKMSEIKDYTLEMGPEIKIPGKVFGGQSVNATGGEFSFQSFAPQRQDSSTLTRTTRNCISSSAVRASSR